MIVAGSVQTTIPLTTTGTATSNRYVVEVDVDVTSGQWIVFHARSAQDLPPLHPGRQAFAVSNPVFVQ